MTAARTGVMSALIAVGFLAVWPVAEAQAGDRVRISVGRVGIRTHSRDHASTYGSRVIVRGVRGHGGFCRRFAAWRPVRRRVVYRSHVLRPLRYGRVYRPVLRSPPVIYIRNYVFDGDDIRAGRYHGAGYEARFRSRGQYDSHGVHVGVDIDIPID
ncbi:MAG: hypothetical protein KGY99_02975 [Phycisphaerae bacterium]|nr:hypothetical protein [Phycisphaerae bacterium]